MAASPRVRDLRRALSKLGYTPSAIDRVGLLREDLEAAIEGERVTVFYHGARRRRARLPTNLYVRQIKIYSQIPYTLCHVSPLPRQKRSA